MKKICIVTSGHPPTDERIFWKFALSLNEHGFKTAVFCSTRDISTVESGVLISGFDGENLKKRGKINKLAELIASFGPDIIICCEPLTLLAAAGYRRKSKTGCRIISDVTEWYPENVAFKFHGIRRMVIFAGLYLFNIYCTSKADELIIGEERKKNRYNLIAPFKKKTIIGYYPVLKYFEYSLNSITDELVLCYAGLISFERGILTLIEAASRVAARNRHLDVRVRLVGRFQDSREQEHLAEMMRSYRGIRLEYSGWTAYDQISGKLKDVHICFDLRVRNFIYNNSLPIKIFEYMAAGKPFIYSNIRPIREEIEYEYCGQLVEPNDIDGVVNAIEKYLHDRDLIMVHSKNGRSIIEGGKNWEKESLTLIELVRRI